MKSTLDNHIESISISLKKIVRILFIICICIGIAVFYALAYSCYTEISLNEFSDSYGRVEVVVAKTNLLPGAVLSLDNIGGFELSHEENDKEEFVRADNFKVLLGHHVIGPVDQGAPITWTNTTIIINNREHLD